MRSVSELMNLVQDGEVTTVEQARAIIEQEVRERVEMMECLGGKPQTTEETKAILLDNIGWNTGYVSHALADRIMELYETEHPAWGRKHPTPEEITQLGIEYGLRKRREHFG